MAKWEEECMREILMCSFSLLSCLWVHSTRRSFLTPFTYFLLFTIIPSNLIQLLKNEIFEESAVEEISWKKIWSWSATNKTQISLRNFAALKTILYCVDCENDPSFFPFAFCTSIGYNKTEEKFSGTGSNVIWCSKWNQSEWMFL